MTMMMIMMHDNDDYDDTLLIHCPGGGMLDTLSAFQMKTIRAAALMRQMERWR